MRFFTSVLNCECGKEATLLRVGFSSDGHVVFQLICIFCGRDWDVQTTMEQLIVMAAMELNHQTYAVEGTLTDN